MKFLSRFYIFIIFAILYAPILVVILFSFNASGNLSNFSGFTLYWYKDLFRSGEAIEALKNSLILAVCSSALATILGTLASFSIAHSKNKYYQSIMKSVTNIPAKSIFFALSFASDRTTFFSARDEHSNNFLSASSYICPIFLAVKNVVTITTKKNGIYFISAIA